MPQGATPSSTGSRVRGLPGWEAGGDPARAIKLNHAIPTAALSQAVNSSSASAPQMTASRRPGSGTVVGVDSGGADEAAEPDGVALRGYRP